MPLFHLSGTGAEISKRQLGRDTVPSLGERGCVEPTRFVQTINQVVRLMLRRDTPTGQNGPGEHGQVSQPQRAGHAGQHESQH